MKIKLFISALFLAMLSTAGAQGLKLQPGNYKIDAAHTRVSFLIDHFVVSQVQGRFNDVQGNFYLSEDMKDCKVNVTIPVKSIDTGVKQRDDHLRSADFFDAKKYPNITFKSKKCSGDLEDFKVTGDLTIKDVTKEVTLEAKYTGSVKDSWGQIRAAVQAEGEINRKDFNIKYNDMVEAGPAVGDEVTMKIITEGVLEQPKKK